MYCTNCGQRLADDAKHCPNCGVQIIRDGAAQNTGTGAQPEYDQYGYRKDDYQRDTYQEKYYRDQYSQYYDQTASKPQNSKADGYALTGLILGIVSAVCCCVPYIGVPCSILGIIFSVKGLHAPTRSSMATVGLVLSIIFTVCNVIALVSFIISLANADTWASIMEAEGFDFEEFFDWFYKQY